MADTQNQNQRNQPGSEAASSAGEARRAEPENRLGEAVPAGARGGNRREPHGGTQRPPLSLGREADTLPEHGAEPAPGERPPPKVERFIELRLRGLGSREARRASGLSGSMYTKWRDYIKGRLGEAGLGKAKGEARREAEGAEEAIKELAGGGLEGERTERVKMMEELAAEVEHARRIFSKIFHGLEAPHERPPERPEAAKTAKAEEELKAEAPILIPIKEIRYPDGRVEVHYGLGPEHYMAVRQADMLADQVAPKVVEELGAVRSDISGIGNKLLTLIESYWAPQLKRLSFRQAPPPYPS